MGPTRVAGKMVCLSSFGSASVNTSGHLIELGIVTCERLKKKMERVGGVRNSELLRWWESGRYVGYIEEGVEA